MVYSGIAVQMVYYLFPRFVHVQTNVVYGFLQLNSNLVCHMLQTMNRVFEHAGDLVNIKVAHNLMRLIAEGFGEDDETADCQLRSSAVCSLLTFFRHLLKVGS